MKLPLVFVTIMNKVLTAKHLIHHTHQMDVLITDLDEDAAGFGEEVSGDDEAVRR
jgi:hypothetical protein